MPDKKNTNADNKRLYTQGNKALTTHSLPEDNIVIGNRTIAKSTIRDRAGFNRHDRDRDRPEEILPTDHHEIIESVQALYKRVGLVRNVIDLMADFASENLQLKHPIKTQERFYNAWAERVNLKDRINHFIRALLRDATVIVYRRNGFIPQDVVKQFTRATTLGIPSSDNVKPVRTVNEQPVPEDPILIDDTRDDRKNNIIPWGYTFISPLMVRKYKGVLGKLFNDDSLAFRLPAILSSLIKDPKSKSDRELISKLPPEIVQAAKSKSQSQNLIKLDSRRTYVAYYKKDDWEDWGTPFLYGILEDVLFKDKMRLADISALDGVINPIRLWKLGKSDAEILPTKTAINKILDILSHNTGGGVLDIVWDDMIDFKVEYPPTDKILGEEKYASVDRDILKGLGVPDSLVGGGDSRGGSQRTFVELKTIIERLEYVRMETIKWLTHELRLVAKAMGFKRIPSINFGNMSLRDEAKEKQLIIQLLDRGIISVESVQHVFGYDFIVELERMRNEQQIRTNNDPVLEKAGPFYRPRSIMQLQHDFMIELDSLQNPGENLSGDQPKMEEDRGPGRPNNTTDIDRDERTERVFSSYRLIAEDILQKIDNIVDQKFLKLNSVKNIRSLTKDQKDRLDNIKYSIFACMGPNDNINEDSINRRINQPVEKMVNLFYETMGQLKNEYISHFGKSISHKDNRSLAISAWSILYGG